MVRSEENMSLKNPVTPPGIDPGTVRLVALRLNHYATPGPKLGVWPQINLHPNYADFYGAPDHQIFFFGQLLYRVISKLEGKCMQCALHVISALQKGMACTPPIFTKVTFA